VKTTAPSQLLGVARMERSVIRERRRKLERLIPDYAEFIIGPAEGRTRRLQPGYEGRAEGDVRDDR
jgi:hypothetical protein